MNKRFILCVDDDITVLTALRFVVSNSFEENYSLELAESADEALEIVNDLKREGSDLVLVISDFLMPEMNGDELLIRIHAISPETIKIMLTGQSDLQGIKRAINEANLYRFLEKPFNNSDLMLTTKSALQSYQQERELEKRNRELEAINNYLEQKVKERTFELNKSLEIIKADLSLAKKIQGSILQVKPALLKELNIVQTYMPMSEVGGDFYDVNKVGDFKYRFFLADATGHGVQAAMITMAIKGIYDNLKNVDLETSQIMEMFNNEYMSKYSTINSFMTAILIDIDIKNFRLKYSSAGHPACILLLDNQMLPLSNTGKMIGILKDAKYKSHAFAFNFSDRLYIFTDGVFEEFNSKKEEFGEERLYAMLTENKYLPIEQIFKNILNELDQFLDGQEIQDDITILGIEYLKSNGN